MSRAEQPQESPRQPSPQAPWPWTGIAAMAFGITTTGVVGLFQGGKPPADLTLTSVLVFLTVGAAGGWSWWLLVARRGRVSAGRGALAGALTALLGSLLVFQVANLVYGAAAPGFLGVTPLAKVVVGLILSVVTLLFSGWFLIPLLALVGAGLALAQLAAAPSLEGGLLARLRGRSQRSAALLRGRPVVRTIVALVCIAGLLVTSAGVWVWSRPLFVGDLAAAPAPVGDYGASVAAIEAQIAAEIGDPALNPTCASRLLTPGRRTERVIVFFHGFTNCPAQFVPGDDWARSGAAVRRYTFPADLSLNHDLIDGNNPEQRVALVYPTLISLIADGAAGRAAP